MIGVGSESEMRCYFLLRKYTSPQWNTVITFPVGTWQEFLVISYHNGKTQIPWRLLQVWLCHPLLLPETYSVKICPIEQFCSSGDQLLAKLMQIYESFVLHAHRQSKSNFHNLHLMSTLYLKIFFSILIRKWPDAIHLLV